MKRTSKTKTTPSPTPSEPLTAQGLRDITERAERARQAAHERLVTQQYDEVLTFCRPFAEQSLRMSEDYYGDLHADTIARLESDKIVVEKRGATSFFRFRW